MGYRSSRRSNCWAYISIALVLLSGFGSTPAYAGTTSYVYDDLGRVTLVTYPDTSTVSYSYDAAGNRTQVTSTVINANPFANADSQTTAYNSPLSFDPRTNDSDPNRDSLSITAVGAASHGTTSFSATAVTYTPTTNFVGSDSFSYTISDGHGGTGTGTITVTVSAPLAPTVSAVSNQSVTYNSSGTAITLLPSGNYTTLAVATPPAHGSVTISGTTATYVPTSGYYGTDSFTYTATGPGGTSSAASVAITVATPSAPTVAAVSNQSVSYNSPGTAITLLPSGNYTSLAVVTAPTKGTVTISGTTATYVPTTGQTGADSFTYRATGPGGTSSAASVALTIAGPGSGTNLLVNGSFEAPTISSGGWGAFQSVTGWTLINSSGRIELWNNANGVVPTHGNNSGELDYEGNTDGFYQDVQTTNGQGYAFSIDLMKRPGNYSSSTMDVEVLWNNTLIATLSPAANWSTFTLNVTGTGGADRLTIRNVAAQDGDGIGAMYDNLKLIASGSSNGPPTAAADSIATTQNVAKTFDPRSNDTDPNGDTLSITGVGSAAHGTTAYTGASITYTPVSGYTGSDSFTYTISDGNGGTASGTVTVLVTVPSSGNLLVNGSFEASSLSSGTWQAFQSVSGWTALTSAGRIELWNNVNGVTPTDGSISGELDYEGETDGFYQDVTTTNGQGYAFSIDLMRRPGSSASTTDVEILWNNVLITTISPATSWTTYSVNLTGTGGSNRLTVKNVAAQDGDGIGAMYDNLRLVTSGGSNAAPVANSDTTTTATNTAKTLDPRSNDTDPNGDTLTITAVGSAAHGTTTFTGTSVTYTPTTGYTGSDSFTYAISDGNGGTASGTINVTVSNAVPVANTDTTTTTAGTAKTFDPRANDTDANGDALTITGVGTAAHGTVSYTGTSVTYTPTAGYTGSDTFTYTISDGRGGSATGTVNVTVGTASGTNLLVNGSFESPSVSSGSYASFQSIQGWTAISGGWIEVINNRDYMTASNGSNFGELDYDSAYDGFYQDVQTVSGQSYTFSIDLRQRPNFGSTPAGMEVVWNGIVVATLNPSTSSWVTYTLNVTGTGAQDRLTLREVSGQHTDGLGAIYDNLKLIAN